MQAIYRVSGQQVHTSGSAAGPWHPNMQHGAAPAALVAWAAEHLPADEPMRLARLSLDLCRPVPVGALTIRAAILRAGRKIQVATIDLLANGVEVVRGTILRVRQSDGHVPEDLGRILLDLPPPEASYDIPPERRVRCPFLEGVSAKLASGSERLLGPSAMWFRANQPIVDGAPISAAMRAAIAADLCNGVSSPLDPQAWSFINSDMTLNLARLPAGEWILVNATTILGGDGGGIASAALADRDGYFARASQSLIIERRPSDDANNGKPQ
jgi:Acyl-CoA thioesterase C-terminal domain/Acyl-CoA thioesterase N-terminal domain